MKNVKINLLTLKPLHQIGKYLGIWPVFNVQTMEKCGSQYMYGIIVLFLILLQVGYGLYGKIILFNYIETSVFVIATLADLAVTATNVTTIVGVNFLQGCKLQAFLHNMQSLEVIFKRIKKDEQVEHRNFFLEMIIGHILYVIYLIYNCFEWIHVFGWELSKFTIMRDAQAYHVFVTTLLMRNYVLLIMYKMETVNYVLEHYDHGLNNDIFMTPGSAKGAKDPQKWDLDFISAIYTKLANVINQFNTIFGWVFVVLHIDIICNVLLPLNLALVYGDGKTQLLGKTFDYNLLMLCIVWVIVPLCYMMTVTSACDRVKKEVAKMQGICYNLIMNNKQDEEFVRKLKDLAMQGHILSPEFTANGFFNINYSLIMPTMGSIISYVIVLVQFRS